MVREQLVVSNIIIRQLPSKCHAYSSLYVMDEDSATHTHHMQAQLVISPDGRTAQSEHLICQAHYAYGMYVPMKIIR